MKTEKRGRRSVQEILAGRCQRKTCIDILPQMSDLSGQDLISRVTGSHLQWSDPDGAAVINTCRCCCDGDVKGTQRSAFPCSAVAHKYISEAHTHVSDSAARQQGDCDCSGMPYVNIVDKSIAPCNWNRWPILAVLCPGRKTLPPGGRHVPLHSLPALSLGPSAAIL